MANPATDLPPIKPSPALAARAKLILSRAPVSSALQLNAFSFSAGFLAGVLIKRTKPR